MPVARIKDRKIARVVGGFLRERTARTEIRVMEGVKQGFFEKLKYKIASGITRKAIKILLGGKTFRQEAFTRERIVEERKRLGKKA